MYSRFHCRHKEIRETSIWNLNESVQHKLGTDDILGNGSDVAVICWMEQWMENVFNTLHITAAVSTDHFKEMQMLISCIRPKK